MPTAWFLVPYAVAVDDGVPVRHIDFGAWPGIVEWSEVEVLGDQAAVKVKAADEILDSMEGQFVRFSDIDLAIPDNDRARLRQIGLDAGYSLEQVDSVDAGITTYRQFLEALATYRTKMRAEGVGVDTVFVPDSVVPAAKSIAGADVEV